MRLKETVAQKIFEDFNGIQCKFLCQIKNFLPAVLRFLIGVLGRGDRIAQKYVTLQYDNRTVNFPRIQQMGFLLFSVYHFYSSSFHLHVP